MLKIDFISVFDISNLNHVVGLYNYYMDLVTVIQKVQCHAISISGKPCYQTTKSSSNYLIVIQLLPLEPKKSLSNLQKNKINKNN